MLSVPAACLARGLCAVHDVWARLGAKPGGIGLGARGREGRVGCKEEASHSIRKVGRELLI